MKQLIISKTIMFIFILAFVMGFESIFGADNMLIGVAVIVTLLMLLERNLTVAPWKYFFLLLTLNVFQGIAGYIAVNHLWLGIPINFIAMFIVGYFFSYNLRKSLYIGFGLQYLFILTFPVSASELPLRLMSLVAGTILIMLSQLLFNRKKVTKAGTDLLIGMIDNLITQLNSGQDLPTQSFEVRMRNFKNMIYDHRENKYYFSKEGRIKLKIASCLQTIQSTIIQLDMIEEKDQIKDALINDLNNLKTTISTKGKQAGVESSLSLLLENFSKTNNDCVYMYRLVSTFHLLDELIEQLNTLNTKQLQETEKITEIPANFLTIYNHFSNLNMYSVRFTYAIRVAVGITIAAWMIQYFQLEQGRWFIYTVFSVVQPYSEHAKERFKERFIGTVIGILVFLILFSIFKDQNTRTIVVLLAGYIHSFAKTYRSLVWTLTLSAIGTAALVGDPTLLSLDRLALVTAGIFLGILLNRFVFPYNLVTGTKQLMTMHKKNSNALMSELYLYLKNRNNIHTINNLFTISSLIEERIILNNEKLQDSAYEVSLSEQRKLNNTIYALFLQVQHKHFPHDTLTLILDNMDRIIKRNTGDFEALSKQIQKDIYQTVNINDKIILTDILEIFQGFKRYEKI